MDFTLNEGISRASLKLGIISYKPRNAVYFDQGTSAFLLFCPFSNHFAQDSDIQQDPSCF